MPVDIIVTAAATAIATTAVIFLAVPVVGDACDRRRWFIAVRKRRREIRRCTQKSLDWHSRAKYATLNGRERRAEQCREIAARWDERLNLAADSDNVDWLMPSWIPVLPTREPRQRRAGRRQDAQPQRRAKYAPPLTATRARS